MIRLLNRHGPFVRQPSVWSHAVDHAWQVLAKLRQEIARLHSCLARHVLNLIMAEDRFELLWGDRLVRSGSDP